MYAGSGIWQTVWIEPVRPGAVKDSKMVTNMDNGSLKITVNTYDAQPSNRASRPSASLLRPRPHELINTRSTETP